MCDFLFFTAYVLCIYGHRFTSTAALVFYIPSRGGPRPPSELNPPPPPPWKPTGDRNTLSLSPCLCPEPFRWWLLLLLYSLLSREDGAPFSAPPASTHPWVPRNLSSPGGGSGGGGRSKQREVEGWDTHAAKSFGCLFFFLVDANFTVRFLLSDIVLKTFA